MEGLNGIMKSASQSALFHGLQTPNNRLSIPYLFYDDDDFFFGDWANVNFSNMSHILCCFQDASCLKVNFNKSWVWYWCS